jgi:glycosyltransferase involved in cell wall biosynthesis
MPVCNGETYIARAIDSVLAQQFGDLELIISDNASTDATEQICRDYLKRDERVRYSRNEVNLGAAPNYNRVFQLAAAEYFKWAAHDDELEPAFLNECVATLDREGPQVVLAFPRTKYIDPQGQLIRLDTDRLDVRGARPRQRLGRFVSQINLCNALLGVIRSGALAKTRLIGSFIASDYILLAELSLLGEFREVPDYLFRRRLHPGQHRGANKTKDEIADWFERGRRASKWLSVRSNLFVEYLRSIRRAELSPAQRLGCWSTFVYHWTKRDLRTRAGALRNSIKTALSRPGKLGSSDPSSRPLSG